MTEEYKAINPRLTSYPRSSSEKEAQLEAILADEPDNVHTKKIRREKWIKLQSFSQQR